MQILATPLLYKNMEIFANRLDETLLATLKEDHSGLSQVRTLRIKPHGLWKFGAMWSDERELQAKIVYRLLHVIPKNFLTLFEHDIRYTWGKENGLTFISGSQTQASSVLEYVLLFVFVRRRSAATNSSVV